MKAIVVLVAFGLLIGCSSRPKLEGRETAMRPVQNPIQLRDDLPFEPLAAGIRQNIEKLKAQRSDQMIFGPRTISRDDYVLSLEYLLEVLEKQERSQALRTIQTEFDFFEIYGDTKWGEVFMTSYYDPVIPGSLKKTKKFSQPLYAFPDDLVSIQFGKFLDTFPRLRKKMEAPHEQKSDGSVIRGRITKNKKVVPYFSRQEIDENNALKGRKLEIVYVDPIKSFTLQIQGSGIVQLPSGKKMRVGYAGQNGHKYVAIGRYLLDVIPIEKMSMQAIESHLASLSQKEMQDILNKNPSYVFFRKLKTKSITYFGVEVVEGRTLATDYRYFPKGAVAFLEFESPVFSDNRYEADEWVKKARLVLDQDTGGAIRGAHRLDLYWGEGAEAERAAGVMRRHGTLYYLAPSEELLQRLKAPRVSPLSTTFKRSDFFASK